MMFIVRNQFSKHVQSCSWRGRCGAIHLLQRPTSLISGFNIYTLGVHGAHDELLIDTLSDLSYLIRRRPFGSKLVIAGDWNVDLLPSLSVDPWTGVDGRDEHHADRRALLEAFADSLRLKTLTPTQTNSVPGGPFSEHCLLAPHYKDSYW